MIHIGLTGWGDHHKLYASGVKPQDKLATYAAHFICVEVDASFYAIQPEKNTLKWVNETPTDFKFIVKAYQGMTGHARGDDHYQSKSEMFETFKVSLKPFIDAGKLAMVLFQFPPWFDVSKDHLLYLRYVKQKMGNLPVAIEFRNQSWYKKAHREETIEYLKKLTFYHSIADEPQVGDGSVPFVPISTHKDKVLIRLHGRNRAGWTRPEDKETNWREVRYLYRYNKIELEEIKKTILALEKVTKEVYVIFNNNSGTDASDNGKMLKQMLDIAEEGLAARQLSLF